MNYASILHELTKIGPRFAENEIKAAKIIEEELHANKVDFSVQTFETEVPVCVKAELTADGNNIKCIGSTLKSGIIPNGDFLVSNLGYSCDSAYNIAYSPVTDEISLVDHYKVPSLTISRKDIVKVVMAKNVSGLVEVERRKISTENILAGNLENPECIVFAHFDSIVGNGALDNAGSIAVVMSCLNNNKNLLKTTLFVFSGNEEVSYDEYKMSGYGFRVFEEKYSTLLEKARRIIVLDGVGVGKPSCSQTGLDWVLQVKMLDKIIDKVFWLQNDQTLVLPYFHTAIDNPDIIDNEYLIEAEKLLEKGLLQ